MHTNRRAALAAMLPPLFLLTACVDEGATAPPTEPLAAESAAGDAVLQQVPPIHAESLTGRHVFPDDVAIQIRNRPGGRATTVVNVQDATHFAVLRIAQDDGAPARTAGRGLLLSALERQFVRMIPALSYVVCRPHLRHEAHAYRRARFPSLEQGRPHPADPRSQSARPRPPEGSMCSTRPLLTLPVGCLILLVACGESATAPEDSQPTSLIIEAPQTLLRIGETVKVTARVLDQKGVAMTGHTVGWSSSDPAVASVSPGGLLIGLRGGVVEVRAEVGVVSASEVIQVIPLDCPADGAGPAISLGETHMGVLDEQSCLFETAPAEGRPFALDRAARVRIDLGSDEFDPLLVVMDPTGEPVAWDDDDGDGWNARIVRVLEPGTYVVWSVAWPGTGTGPYQLSVAELGGESCDEPVGSVTPDTTVTGTLGLTSCILDDGSFANPWELVLDESATLRIDLMSSEFDTFLFLTDAQGEWVAEDDDGGSGLNSRLVVTLDPGRYAIWASGFWSSDIGAYTLSVNRVDAGAGVAVNLD